jgi:hypothetical protein
VVHPVTGEIIQRRSASSQDFSVGEFVDSLIWRNVPNGIGAYGSFDMSFKPFKVFGSYGEGEVAGVFNWRSGELSFALSSDMGLEVSTPDLVSGDVATGLLFPMGYSSNDAMLGQSLDFGIEVQADAVARSGLEVGETYESNYVVDPYTREGRFVPVYDKVSKMQPYMVNFGRTVGAGLEPTIVDASVSLGMGETFAVATVQLYPWKWGPGMARILVDLD